MTPQQISQDVATAIEQRSIIKTAQVILKACEKRLELAGLEGDQIPLQEADREGRQYLARCPQLNLIVPVVFESDQVIASLQSGSDLHQHLVTISGDHFPLFFAASGKLDRVQKDGQEFRQKARAAFGLGAPEFVALCLQRDKAGIPKSRTIIAWDNARKIDPATA